MKPKRVALVLFVLATVFVVGSTLAYSKFPEHYGYIDLIMVIYIVLFSVFGVVMLRRSKTA
jgi:uncharacterized membrane protein